MNNLDFILFLLDQLFNVDMDNGPVTVQKVKPAMTDLKDFTLWTFVKNQGLLIQWVKGLSCNSCLLFGYAGPVLQKIHFDVWS